MITRKFDKETLTLTKFYHPLYGYSRILGDYDENPCVNEYKSTEPHYKCQQIEDTQKFFMETKSEVKKLIASPII